MTPDPIIQLEAVTKVYGSGEAQVQALKGIGLTIEPGEFVAVMGPSGSGKSTLMNIIGCLDRPTAGQYRLAGEDVSRLNRAKLADVRGRKIGFIFQSFNLLRQATALENVLLPLMYDRHNRRSPKEREAAARAVLEAVGLADRAKHLPNQLSGGQQQRVAIARALINNPALILADEPTGNLDTQSSDDIMSLLHELHGRGRTIVMVTHEPDIATHAQRSVFVRDGLIASAAPAAAAHSMPALLLPAAMAERI
jgi:putative ABC transport system ATP-binding protein